jgi:hypothetical protein
MILGAKYSRPGSLLGPNRLETDATAKEEKMSRIDFPISKLHATID